MRSGALENRAVVEALRTALCRMLGIEWPVLSVGFGTGAGAELVAAVSGAGAFGVIGATGMPADFLRADHPVYKARIVASTAADTVYTERLYDVGWPDAPHRTLRNRTYAEWQDAGCPPSGQRPGEDSAIGLRHSPWTWDSPWPRYSPSMVTADFDGDLDSAPLWAGESCSVVNDIKPTAAIVQDLIRDAANELG